MSKKILVAEDDQVSQHLLRRTLTNWNYEVTTVSDGKAALDVLLDAKSNIHLAILDWMMPELNGPELCRILRARPDAPFLYLILLSARDSKEDVVGGLDAGADDYIRFDSAPPLVLARVRRLIQFRKMAGLAMLDRQLVQIGRLLAGIVHEIRGPLSVIRGSAELLRLSLQDRPDDSQWVESILRGSSLLQLRLEHLMGAVRSGPIQMQPIDVSSLLAETVGPVPSPH